MSMSDSTGVHALLRTPKVSVKVRSSAWRYLKAEMNPDEDVLVMVLSDDGWIAGVLPRKFPGTPTEALEARLDRYTVLFPQPASITSLDGRTLEFTENVLSVS